MKEPAHLLHNMSAAPRSVISFKGVSTVDDDAQSRRSDISKGRVRKPEIIAFKVVPSGKRRTPLDVLTEIGVIDTSNPDSTLAQLIDERAEELPLPDGCAVIDYQPDHVQKWQDELAQLAVLCKSSASVWLRSKAPLLSLIDDRHSVSLFLPFGLRD